MDWIYPNIVMYPAVAPGRWHCTCDQCGGEWVSKTERLPRHCARCGSAAWNASDPRSPEEVQAAALAESVVECRADIEEQLKTAPPPHVLILRQALADLEKYEV